MSFRSAAGQKFSKKAPLLAALSRVDYSYEYIALGYTLSVFSRACRILLVLLPLLIGSLTIPLSILFHLSGFTLNLSFLFLI